MFYSRAGEIVEVTIVAIDLNDPTRTNDEATISIEIISKQEIIDHECKNSVLQESEISEGGTQIINFATSLVPTNLKLPILVDSGT